jgi:hypothetical protein
MLAAGRHTDVVAEQPDSPVPSSFMRVTSPCIVTMSPSASFGNARNESTVRGARQFGYVVEAWR